MAGASKRIGWSCARAGGGGRAARTSSKSTRKGQLKKSVACVEPPGLVLCDVVDDDGPPAHYDKTLTMTVTMFSPNSIVLCSRDGHGLAFRRLGAYP